MTDRVFAEWTTPFGSTETRCGALHRAQNHPRSITFLASSVVGRPLAGAVSDRSANCGRVLPLRWTKWGAGLAIGEGRERIYIVEPTGPIVDDPNLTDWESYAVLPLPR